MLLQHILIKHLIFSNFTFLLLSDSIIDTKKRKLDPDRFCDSPILIENIDLTPESPDCESDKSWEKVVDLLLNKQKAYNIKRSMTRLQEVSLP